MNKRNFAAQVAEKHKEAALERRTYGCQETSRNVAKELIEYGCARTRMMVRRYFCIDDSYTLPAFCDKGLLLSKMFPGIGWRNHIVVVYMGRILDPLVGRPLKEPAYLDAMFKNKPSSIRWARESLKETLESPPSLHFF